MDFYDAYNSIVLGPGGILAAVDEYTLYCYYTGIKDLVPGKCYRAPYREDTVPSLTFFNSRSPIYEYMWKDQATNESGDIFALIRKIERLDSSKEVYARINHDFDLGFDTPTPIRREKLSLYDKPSHSEIKITLVEQDFTKEGIAFWDQFRIDRSYLDRYSVSQVSYYWSYVGQSYPKTVSNPTFAYRIGKYYQLYSPYNDKANKFRNDLPESYFCGYLQLPTFGSVLVIDKSFKDVIFCSRLGYNAVCGKSETIMIPHTKMLELRERFSIIYLTLDPDEAGRKQTDKYMSLYPWLKPRFLTQAKDKTDLCKLVGFDKAQATVKKLLT